MRLISTRSLTLLFILFSCCACFGQTTTQGANPSVKFEVSSIRFMTPEERARAGDNLDPDLVMKCRVSNQGKETVYLYTDFANSIVPRGNLVRKTENGLIWVLDSSGRQSSKSPGFSPLKSGSWITLFEGDAAEWECGEISADTEETHAKTVFIKEDVVEVFSNFYKVPAHKTKSLNK